MPMLIAMLSMLTVTFLSWYFAKSALLKRARDLLSYHAMKEHSKRLRRDSVRLSAADSGRNVVATESAATRQEALQRQSSVDVHSV